MSVCLPSFLPSFLPPYLTYIVCMYVWNKQINLPLGRCTRQMGRRGRCLTHHIYLPTYPSSSYLDVPTYLPNYPSTHHHHILRYADMALSVLVLSIIRLVVISQYRHRYWTDCLPTYLVHGICRQVDKCDIHLIELELSLSLSYPTFSLPLSPQEKVDKPSNQMRRQQKIAHAILNPIFMTTTRTSEIPIQHFRLHKQCM